MNGLNNTTSQAINVDSLVSTQTVNLTTTCSFFYFLCRDVKKAEQMTVAWADEHGFYIPENIRRAVVG